MRPADAGRTRASGSYRNPMMRSLAVPLWRRTRMATSSALLPGISTGTTSPGQESRDLYSGPGDQGWKFQELHSAQLRLEQFTELIGAGRLLFLVDQVEPLHGDDNRLSDVISALRAGQYRHVP